MRGGEHIWLFSANSGRGHVPAAHPGTRLLLPHLEGIGACHSVGARCHTMATWAEVAVNRPVCREKALRLAGRLEPLHLALAATRRPMRVLRWGIRPDTGSCHSAVRCSTSG